MIGTKFALENMMIDDDEESLNFSTKDYFSEKQNTKIGLKKATSEVPAVSGGGGLLDQIDRLNRTNTNNSSSSRPTSRRRV